MSQLQAKPDLTIAGVLPCCIKVHWRREFCAFALSHVEYVQGGPVDRVSMISDQRPRKAKRPSTWQPASHYPTASGLWHQHRPNSSSRVPAAQAIAAVPSTGRCCRFKGNCGKGVLPNRGRQRSSLPLRCTLRSGSQRASPGNPVDLYRAVYQSLLSRRSRSCTTRRPSSRSQYLSALSCCIAMLRRRAVIHFT